MMLRKKSIVVALLALVVGAGSVSAATRTVRFRVTGMTWGGCARSVEQALKKTEGVEDARVSYEKGEAWIKYDDGKITVAKLQEVINGTGYKAAGVVKASKSSARGGKRRVT